MDDYVNFSNNNFSSFIAPVSRKLEAWLTQVDRYTHIITKPDTGHAVFHKKIYVRVRTLVMVTVDKFKHIMLSFIAL